MGWRPGSLGCLIGSPADEESSHHSTRQHSSQHGASYAHDDAGRHDTLSLRQVARLNEMHSLGPTTFSRSAILPSVWQKTARSASQSEPASVPLLQQHPGVVHCKADRAGEGAVQMDPLNSSPARVEYGFTVADGALLTYITHIHHIRSTHTLTCTHTHTHSHAHTHTHTHIHHFMHTRTNTQAHKRSLASLW